MIQRSVPEKLYAVPIERKTAILSAVLIALFAGLGAYPSSALLQSQRNIPPATGIIQGVVQSEKGPEAGVWVIAETKDLLTNFIKEVVTDDQGKFLATSGADQLKLYTPVASVLNTLLGAPMVQHGAEFMWAEGVGAKAKERVFWFGPRRRFMAGESSMDTERPN